MTKYFIGKLEDYDLSQYWWLHGLDEYDGIVYESYGTIDELIKELKDLKSYAFVGEKEPITLLYESSTRIHSFQEYLDFLKPIKQLK